MAEFVKVIEEKNRMCKTYQSCLRCPIYKQETCTKFIKKHPEEAEEIIMKWAEEQAKAINWFIDLADLEYSCQEPKYSDVEEI